MALPRSPSIIRRRLGLVLVPVFDISGSGLQSSVTDSGGNSYTLLGSVSPNNSAGNGTLGVWGAPVTTQLTSSSSTISYGSGAVAMGQVFTGQNVSAPTDTGAKATAFGSSTTPSVTSGTPDGSGQIAVGICGVAGLNNIFTQASGFSATSFGGSVASLFFLNMGSKTNAGSSAVTFNPTISPSAAWGEIIILVNPVGVGPVGSSGAFFQFLG